MILKDILTFFRMLKSVLRCVDALGQAGQHTLPIHSASTVLLLYGDM
jgi:hypothetical protein